MMVTRLLSIPVIPQADAADALAGALCHAYTSKTLLKLNAVALRTTRIKK
jgi:crossover junction endodeoxyribonuclease RuvC